MLSQNYPISLLEQALCAGLERYGIYASSIKKHKSNLRALLCFMEERNMPFFNVEVFEAYRQMLLSDCKLSLHYRKTKFCTMSLLADILEGRPHCRHDIHSQGSNTECIGRIDEQIAAFLSTISINRVTDKTLQTYKKTLMDFKCFLSMRGHSLEELTRDDVMEFVGSVQNSRPHKLIHLRKSLEFFHSEGITSADFSKLFAHIKAVRKEKLPSYYSKREILMLEQSIDRASAVGKRDYAMVLLATRLGLRSSDIRTMTFSNIDWDRNEISLVQYKTGRRIILPLLSDVGDAIIDYVRNARPAVPFKEIFVTCSRPYQQISAPGCSAIVQRHLYDAGIDVKGRHTGMHCLRHSLATQMMNNGTVIPVITEVLGHKSMESTMYYLGVNIDNLLECSLDVPIVSTNFYEQKGGMLYE